MAEKNITQIAESTTTSPQSQASVLIFGLKLKMTYINIISPAHLLSQPSQMNDFTHFFNLSLIY